MIPDHIQKAGDEFRSKFGSCIICQDLFGDPCNPEVVMICGHRFHAMCARKWERGQFDMAMSEWERKGKPFKITQLDPDYRCALCRQSYRWKDKWHLTPHTEGWTLFQNRSYFFLFGFLLGVI